MVTTGECRLERERERGSHRRQDRKLAEEQQDNYSQLEAETGMLPPPAGNGGQTAIREFTCRTFCNATLPCGWCVNKSAATWEEQSEN